ncbi:MAG: tetratricopeptide repeat protein [Bryobacteraceae bacterium]
MSTLRFSGIILFCASLHAQMSAVPSRGAPTNRFLSPVLSASGDNPIADDFPPFASDPGPISGVVSLRELEHPVSAKALREAYQAQELTLSKKFSKAIAKLEEVIRIAPQYRDAHLNLGVLYARNGRTAEARTQFQKALDIGPPAAPIYTDLALTSLAIGQYREAEELAHKALQLDPADNGAQLALQYALTH